MKFYYFASDPFANCWGLATSTPVIIWPDNKVTNLRPIIHDDPKWITLWQEREAEAEAARQKDAQASSVDVDKGDTRRHPLVRWIYANDDGIELMIIARGCPIELVVTEIVILGEASPQVLFHAYDQMVTYLKKDRGWDLCLK